MIEFETLAKSDINKAKKQLAFKLTELCHGKIAAELALETAIKVFEQGSIDHNLPTISVKKERLVAGILAYELFYEAKLVDSKSEGRRLIKGGGAKINDQVIKDEHLIININFILDSQVIKLSAGKKKHLLVTVSQ